MKPHLPISLFSALLMSTACSFAAAPSGTVIVLDPLTSPYELSGTGTQSGLISGNGTLQITSGEVRISSGVDKTNTYSGETIVNSGASLKFSRDDFKDGTLYQLGISSLTLYGTLNFAGGNYGVSTSVITNDIKLKNGAVIKSDDGHFTFNGGLNLDLQTGESAAMNMAWGKIWKLNGLIAGQGTLNLRGNANGSGDEQKVFEISGASNTFSGVYNLDSTGVNGTYLALSLKHENAAKNATINLSGNAEKSFLVLDGTNATIGGLTGNGKVKNGTATAGYTGSFTQSATSRTLTVNQTNSGTDVFNGTIDNNVDLIKSGNGTLQFTNLNGYTGSLTAQSGILDVNFNGSSYNLGKAKVDAGATLKLSNGSYSISSENVSLGAGMLEFAGTNSFTFNTFIDANGDAVIGKLTMNGSITGASTVMTNKAINTGDSYILFVTDSEANAATSAGNLTFNDFFYEGAFSANGNNIVLNISGYADDALLWTGGSGEWAMNGSTWQTNQGGGALFAVGKKAIFAKIDGVTEATVSLSGDITTKGILFNSDTTNYTLAGTGKITGDATLVKKGTNTVTIQTANDYTGRTDIQGGTLAVVSGGSIAGVINVRDGATLSMTRSGDMSAAFGGDISIVEGGKLSLDPGAGNTINFNKTLASGSMATLEINSGTVSCSSGASANGIIKLIVNKDATFNTGNLANNRDGMITEINGGHVVIGTQGNNYILADRNNTLIFQEHAGTIDNQSGMWRWEGEGNKGFKLVVKEEASGSVILGGSICLTRAKDGIGTAEIDIQGENTLLTISSNMYAQNAGAEGLTKKGTGTLVLSGENQADNTHLYIENGTVQTQASSSWRGHVYIKKDASGQGHLLVNNNWAVKAGNTFANDSLVTVKGAGSGLDISVANVSGLGDYVVDQGNLNIGNKVILGSTTLSGGGSLTSNGGIVGELIINAGSSVTGLLTTGSLQFNLVENFNGTYLTSTAGITFTGGLISLNLDGMTGSYALGSEHTFKLGSDNMLSLGDLNFDDSYSSNFSGDWDFKSYDSATGNLVLTFGGSGSVPEPSSVTLSLLGLTALLMRRRRK